MVVTARSVVVADVDDRDVVAAHEEVRGIDGAVVQPRHALHLLIRDVVFHVARRQLELRQNGAAAQRAQRLQRFDVGGFLELVEAALPLLVFVVVPVVAGSFPVGRGPA